MNRKLIKSILLVLTLILALGIAVPASAAKNAISFDQSNNTAIFEGESLQLTVTGSGACEGADVTFSSNSRNISVTADGYVTGLNRGTASVTATAKVGKNTFRANINLKIERAVQSLTLDTKPFTVTTAGDSAIAALLTDASDDAAYVLEGNPDAQVLVVSTGKTYTLRATVQPKDASNAKVTYSTANPTIAQTTGNGLKPLKKGVTVLTAASVLNPDVTEEWIVLVTEPVRKMTISIDAPSCYVNADVQASVAITPNTASIQAVNWESSNTKVAIIDTNGVITGISRGQTTITAIAQDGSKVRATLGVSVRQQPEEITLNNTSILLDVGKTTSVTPSFYPKNTDDRAVTWSSSDPHIATVNQQGRISGVSIGDCVITCCSTAFPDVYAEVNVSVQQPVTSIRFRSKSLTINVGETGEVFWDVQPANATHPEVTLTSSNTRVATVDENGVVTGISRGSVTIKAQSTDGSRKSAQINVNVLQPVEGVHMRNDTIRVGVNEHATAQAVLEPSNASNTHMTWEIADPYYATVTGTSTKANLTGHHWGTTTLTGTTEDGGYTTSCTVHVGNLDKALSVHDLYLDGSNKIKINVRNESNLTITKFTFRIEAFDIYDKPMAISGRGKHYFLGSYRYTLEEGENTTHGRFTFDDYVQPSTQMGRIIMTILSYTTSDGTYREIKADRQVNVEYKSPTWVGPTPTPTPKPTPEPEPDPIEFEGSEGAQG